MRSAPPAARSVPARRVSHSSRSPSSSDFQQSAAGTVLVYLDISLPGNPSDTSSAAIGITFAKVEHLFTECNGSGQPRIGCPAGSPNWAGVPNLVAALQQFGLPCGNAYYNQQPTTGHRKMLLR